MILINSQLWKSLTYFKIWVMVNSKWRTQKTCFFFNTKVLNQQIFAKITLMYLPYFLLDNFEGLYWHHGNSIVVQRKKLGVGWNIIGFGEYPNIYILQRGSLETHKSLNIEVIIINTSLWFMNKSTTTCILKPQSCFLKVPSEA